MPSWNGHRAGMLVLICVSVSLGTARRGLAFEDEPRGLSRLFRIGGSSASSKKPAQPKHKHDHDTPPNSPPRVVSEKVISGPSTPLSMPTPANGPALSGPSTGLAGPSTPAVIESGATPRLLPQSRVQRPVTEADPILSRVTIGRSDNGGQFGMFLQIFADGTVLDGEGVHRVGREALRPIVEILESGDIAKLKGHCGAPPTDFIEQVHFVVYDRAYGRLRASAFSFTGNPQGCDPSVKKLQAAIDQLALKLASPSVAVAPADANPTILSGPQAKPGTASAAPVLPLTNPTPGLN